MSQRHRWTGRSDSCCKEYSRDASVARPGKYLDTLAEPDAAPETPERLVPTAYLNNEQWVVSSFMLLR